ncbi:MAG TPA: glycosyltransferase family 8 protein [Gemmatimonadaceae bacterium]
MHQDPIIIACGTDAGYVMPLAVMLRSVAEHLRDDRRVTCYVLYAGVTESDRARVTEGLPAHFEVKWIAADPSRVRGVPVWGRMPVTTYFKLLVPDLLPADETRAIWLDCDMLVTRDITSLWRFDLNGRAAAAAQDQVVPLVSSRGGISVWNEVGIPGEAKYFNAGVMVIDLVKWRTKGIASRALDYLRRNARSVMFWDQEGLNVSLASEWTELPRTWNVNVSVPGWRNAPRGGAPSILHFAGMLKPWSYRTTDPEWSLYNQYLDHTAWAGLRPEQTALRKLISFYERSGIRRVTHSLETIAVGFARRFSLRGAGRSEVHVRAPMGLESR